MENEVEQSNNMSEMQKEKELYQAFNSVPPVNSSDASGDNQNSDSHVLRCLQRFKRSFFHDHQSTDCNPWEELEGRVLPADVRCRIISACALHCHNIHALSSVASRSNATTKVYKCSTCPDTSTSWSVLVSLNWVKSNAWQVCPTCFANNRMT